MGDYKLNRAETAESHARAAEERAAERERDEAQRAKYGTPCRCESWISACRGAEETPTSPECTCYVILGPPGTDYETVTTSCSVHRDTKKV